MNFKFNLGDEVKTKVTGYKGIIRGRSDYLTGCNTYGIQSQKLDKEGLPKKWQWFDEDELILVKTEKIKLIDEKRVEFESTERFATVATEVPRRGGPLSSDKISKE